MHANYMFDQWSQNDFELSCGSWASTDSGTVC